ncbi:hypothetical protein [Serratia marcescens]|uniref:hypothetical protein n=1 Tax=Serratia marcescens TaxID=615 RepID=UPI003204E384
MNGKLFVFLSVCFLAGCGVRSMSLPNPKSYANAADYANALVSDARCTGSIDRVLGFPVGKIFLDYKGRLNFAASNATAHCTKKDFSIAMGKYCHNKGGVYQYSWCAVNNDPIFYVGEFTTVEKGRLGNKEWMEFAISQGFTNDEVRANSQREYGAQQKKIQSILRANVDANIGDLVCKYDENYDVHIIEGSVKGVLYKGYVEGKSNDKYKIRLVWHGEGNSSFDLPNDKVIWSSQVGWFHCQ